MSQIGLEAPVVELKINTLPSFELFPPINITKTAKKSKFYFLNYTKIVIQLSNTQPSFIIIRRRNYYCSWGKLINSLNKFYSQLSLASTFLLG
jgi:hypothetical protein